MYILFCAYVHFYYVLLFLLLLYIVSLAQWKQALGAIGIIRC